MPFEVGIAHASFAPGRRDSLHKLLQQLWSAGVHSPVVQTSLEPEHATVWAIRIWEWADKINKHAVILNDDVDIEHLDFKNVIEAVIVAAPNDIISLHGQGNDLVVLAFEGKRWAKSYNYSGPAVILPPGAARRLINFWKSNPSLLNVDGVNEDNIAAQCMWLHKQPALITIPALVKHQTNVPSTLGYDNLELRSSRIPWTHHSFDHLDLANPKTWEVKDPPWVENPWFSASHLELLHRQRLGLSTKSQPRQAEECAFCGGPARGNRVARSRSTGNALCSNCLSDLQKAPTIIPVKLPISCCMMVSEDPYLETSLSAIRPWVAHLVILAHPSALDVARKFADHILLDEPDDAEDLSAKRNRTFAAARFDTVMWLDADDEIIGLEKLPAELEALKRAAEKQGKPSIFYYPYEYAFDMEGRCIDVHYRERLFLDRNTVKWEGRTHEHASPLDKDEVYQMPRNTMVWRHHQNQNNVARRSRDVMLLERMNEESPGNPRTLFLLLRERIGRGELERAKVLFDEYKKVSPWDEERTSAYLLLSELALLQNKYSESLDFALHAMAGETGGPKDPLSGFKNSGALGTYAVAKAYFFLAKEKDQNFPEHAPCRDWRRCVHYYETALAIPDGPLRSSASIERIYARRLMHYAYAALNEVKTAIVSCNEGLKLEPGNEELKAARAHYQEFLSKSAPQDSL